MPKQGKKYLEAAKLVDIEKAYQPEEAVALIKKTARTKFDETVELHLRMGLDPRNAAQQVRGIALLLFRAFLLPASAASKESTVEEKYPGLGKISLIINLQLILHKKSMPPSSLVLEKRDMLSFLPVLYYRTLKLIVLFAHPCLLHRPAETGAAQLVKAGTMDIFLENIAGITDVYRYTGAVIG